MTDSYRRADWSDSFSSWPFQPEPESRFFQCIKCKTVGESGELVYLDVFSHRAAEDLQYMKSSELPDKAKTFLLCHTGKFIGEPDYEGYCRLLNTKYAGTTESNLFIRKQILFRYNDRIRYRRKKEITRKMKKMHAENIKEILALFSPAGIKDVFFKAELMREAGMFSNAWTICRGRIMKESIKLSVIPCSEGPRDLKKTFSNLTKFTTTSTIYTTFSEIKKRRIE